MCQGCYVEAGSPKPEQAAREIAPRLREVDGFGGCHIVIEDWNLEDHNIDFCIANEETTPEEREVMRALRALPEDQRYAAMAVADGYAE